MNDIITINTNYGIFKYKIVDRKIVNKYDIDSINLNYDLTMYTCNSIDERLIVYAKIVDKTFQHNSI